MKIAILSVTEHGRKFSETISAALPEHETTLFSGKKLKDTVASIFSRYDALVFVMALGIVVRVISSHIKSKKTDPAVVVLDEKGNYAISLLSGHLGGANALATLIGERIGATPIITTATEVHNKPSVEGIAERLNLSIENFLGAKMVNSAIVNDKSVGIASDIKFNLELPENVAFVDMSELNPWDFDALVLVTSKLLEVGIDIPHVFMRPKNLIAGVGSKKGIGKENVLNAINCAFNQAGLSLGSLKTLATPDFKVKEKGIIEASQELGVPLTSIDMKDIRQVEGDFESSEYVREKIGVGAVSEPCAVLGALSKAHLLQKKIKLKGVTVAIAEEE
ncbi:MAG: cobalt-precorrin 5A hydrolase [Candidatus Hydrothermarchaeaceae archaeon]